jgi:hypothetical protein
MLVYHCVGNDPVRGQYKITAKEEEEVSRSFATGKYSLWLMQMGFA